MMSGCVINVIYTLKKIIQIHKEVYMSFLPEDYKVPAGQNNYMRFAQGENIFRILSDALIGWEWWTDEVDNEGKQIRTPHRVKDEESIPVTAVDEDGRGVKHFWAMVVWNYQDKRVQILEITQKGIQRAIQALEKSKGWGDPKNYDISVTRTGEKFETEYSVMPIPPKPVEEEILKKFHETYIRLEALYEGENPFEKPNDETPVEEVPDENAYAVKEKKNKERVNPEEIPF